MKTGDLSDALEMKVIAGNSRLSGEVSGLYVGDLLSWVMSHAEKGNAWITVLTNLNTVAVAVLAEVSCIIIPENIAVEEATVKKADQEGVVILGSNMSAYEISYRFHELINQEK